MRSARPIVRIDDPENLADYAEPGRFADFNRRPGMKAETLFCGSILFVACSILWYLFLVRV
jgi:hypothetical protein